VARKIFFFSCRWLGKKLDHSKILEVRKKKHRQAKEVAGGGDRSQGGKGNLSRLPKIKIRQSLVNGESIFLGTESTWKRESSSGL